MYTSWANDLRERDSLWMVSFETSEYLIEEIHVKKIRHSDGQLTFDKSTTVNKEVFEYTSIQPFREYNHSVTVGYTRIFDNYIKGWAFLHYNDAVKYRLERLTSDADDCMKKLTKYQSRLSEIDKLKNKYEFKQKFQVR